MTITILNVRKKNLLNEIVFNTYNEHLSFSIIISHITPNDCKQLKNITSQFRVYNIERKAEKFLFSFIIPIMCRAKKTLLSMFY